MSAKKARPGKTQGTKQGHGQGRSRAHGRDRNQKQSQDPLRMQLTEQLRAWMKRSDLPADRRPLPGSESGVRDLPSEDHNNPSARTDDQEDDELAVEQGSGLVQANLIGARVPAVLLRLRWDGTAVTAQPCTSLPPGRRAQALDLLCKFVEQSFARGLARQKGANQTPLLSESERDELLGVGPQPAPPARRLQLLTKLAVGAGEEVTIDLQENRKANVAMHDLSLANFAYKFAALPDGTPFSLRLLLEDGRGKKNQDETEKHDFDRLPLSIKVLALRRALAAERAAETALTDNDFRVPFQKAVEDLLGMSVNRPEEKRHVTRLREYLVRHQLGQLFPASGARQEQYNRARSAEPGSQKQP